MSDAKAIWLKEVFGLEVKSGAPLVQGQSADDAAAPANDGTATAPPPPPAAMAEPLPPIAPQFAAAPPPAAPPRAPLSGEEARSFADMGQLIDATNRIVARRRAVEQQRGGIATDLGELVETWQTILDDFLDVQAENKKKGKGKGKDEPAITELVGKMQAIGETLSATAQTFTAPASMPRWQAPRLKDVPSSFQSAAGVVKAFENSIGALKELTREEGKIDAEAQQIEASLKRINDAGIPRLQQMKEKCLDALKGGSQPLPTAAIKGAAQSQARPAPEVWDEFAENQAFLNDMFEQAEDEEPQSDEPAATQTQGKEKEKEKEKETEGEANGQAKETEEDGERQEGEEERPDEADEIMARHHEAQRDMRERSRKDYAARCEATPANERTGTAQLLPIVDAMKNMFDRYQELKSQREKQWAELRDEAQHALVALRPAMAAIYREYDAQRKQLEAAEAKAQAEAAKNGAGGAELDKKLAELAQKKKALNKERRQRYPDLDRFLMTLRAIAADQSSRLDPRDSALSPGTFGAIDKKYGLGLAPEVVGAAEAALGSVRRWLSGGSRDWRELVELEENGRCFAWAQAIQPLTDAFGKLKVAKSVALENQRQRIRKILGTGALDDFRINANFIAGLGE